MYYYIYEWNNDSTFFFILFILCLFVGLNEIFFIHKFISFFNFTICDEWKRWRSLIIFFYNINKMFIYKTYIMKPASEIVVFVMEWGEISGYYFIYLSQLIEWNTKLEIIFCFYLLTKSIVQMTANVRIWL